MTRWLALPLLAASALAQQVTPLQMPPGTELHDALFEDVDGDGRRDLVLATRQEDRELRVYLQKAGERPFGGEPDHVLSPVWTDAVAFAVADVASDPGREIVLLSAKGVYAWRPRAPEKERVKKLAECSFLWQLPRASHAIAWSDALHDLNGDGLADLLIPEPDGYRAIFQEAPGRFGAPQILLVPGDPRVQGAVDATTRFRKRVPRNRREIRMSLAMRATGEAIRFVGPLLEVADDLPAPQLRDWDGDGDLDLIAQTEQSLFVWVQGEKGFPARPNRIHRVPVAADRGRKLEVSYSAHILDLDLDRHADCVIFSGDQRSDDVRTQVQFFKQKGKEDLFKGGLPDQLLVLAGFAGLPRWPDVDSDGYPDLMVGAVRPDLLDSLTGEGASRIDVELYLFLNRKGVFPRRPSLVHRTKLQADGLRPARRSMMAHFFGDVSGDGLKDLLLRDQADHVSVLLTRRSQEGLTLHPEPIWGLRIDWNAEVRLGAPRGPRMAPDLLILERNQLLHVRFR